MTTIKKHRKILVLLISMLFGTTMHGSIVKSTLFSYRTNPNSPIEVGVKLDIPTGWHIYGQNPGDVGKPTAVSWRPANTMISLPWPKDQPFTLGPITSYGYSGSVTLPYRLRPNIATTIRNCICLLDRMQYRMYPRIRNTCPDHRSTYRPDRCTIHYPTKHVPIPMGCDGGRIFRRTITQSNALRVSGSILKNLIFGPIIRRTSDTLTQEWPFIFIWDHLHDLGICRNFIGC